MFVCGSTWLLFEEHATCRLYSGGEVNVSSGQHGGRQPLDSQMEQEKL